MKTQVLCAYDSKARTFMAPFFVSHIDVGVRAFAHVVNGGEGAVGQSPEDFTLWHLGSFDDDTATFEFLRPYANLGVGSQFKRPFQADLQGVNDVQHKVA